MLRFALASLTVAIVMVAATADDKVKKPVGTWMREAGEAKVTFAFKSDKLTTTIHTPNGDLVVEAKYEATKDGEIKGEITKIVKNEIGAGLEEGAKFAFKFKIADNTMTLSDLKGNDGNDAGDDAKNLVEGEYKKQKDKKDEKGKDK